jgi:hypothetical protein
MVKLTDMTLADLKVLIAEVVEEQLNGWQNRPSDNRSPEQVLDAMDQLRWTPPSGSPSTTELLREDRGR